MFHADLVDCERLARRAVPTHLAPLTRPSADPRLVYELVPNAETMLGGVKVVTDAHGFRVAKPGFRSARRGEPLRIAVLGASTSFGIRLALEQTYPWLCLPELEAWLSRPVELRCFAVPGYNARQQERLFERHVVPWAPDLLIWHYDHRDAFPALLPDAEAPMDPHLGDNPLRSALIKLLLRILHERRVDDLRFGGEQVSRFETYLYEGRYYEEHIRSLRSVARVAAEKDIPVVFVIFDAFLRRADAYFEPHVRVLHEPLHRRLAGTGLLVLDLAWAYREHMRARGLPDLRSFWLSIDPLDGHPNPACHEFIAGELLAFLRAREDLRTRLSSRR